MLAWYRTLLRLRKQLLAGDGGDDVSATADEDVGVLVVDRGPLRLAFAPGDGEAEVALDGRVVLATWGSVVGQRVGLHDRTRRNGGRRSARVVMTP